MSAIGPVALDSRVLHVDIGEPIRVTLELRSGLLPEDLAAVADRIAAALHVARVDVEPGRIHGYARMAFWVSAPPQADPWAEPVPWGQAVSSVHERVYLGRTDQGEHRWWNPVADMHLIVQGQTRSGKSTAMYGLLAKLADAKDVLVAGVDPTGLLLAPWSRRRDHHAGWQSLGMSNLQAHAHLLERLVKLMDSRIASLLPGQDQVEITPDCPLALVLLEEYPGLVAALSQSQDRKVKAAVLGSVSRLLSEGGKAGMRVITMAQRSDADIIGGFQRGQSVTRLSFRVDSGDALRMLHPGITGEVADVHQDAPAGVALLTRPGARLERLRTPDTSSETYWRCVAPPADDSGSGDVISLSSA